MLKFILNLDKFQLKHFFYETHKFTYKIKQLDVNYVFGFISINLRHFFFTNACRLSKTFNLPIYVKYFKNQMGMFVSFII